MDINDIIHTNHHGSRKFHGTKTAFTQVTHILKQNNEQNTGTATVVTDLSATFLYYRYLLII